MSESAKLERTIARFKAKISEGAFYEAHQNLRTIANRYIKARKFNEVIDILCQGSALLLEANQTASGSDLISYLIEVYNEAEISVSNESRSRLVQLLSLLKGDEPSLKQLSKEITNWSIKHGDTQFGDSQLHHILGTKLLKQNDFTTAEVHLILGTSESMPLYVNYLFEWSLEDVPENSSTYLSRCVINYLYLENIKLAKIASNSFINNLVESGRLPQHTQVEEGSSLQIIEFTNDPLLNFLQLLILTVQRDSKDLFIRLRDHYSSQINNANLRSQVDYLGQIYFGITVKNPGNMLQDLMSGFFK